MAQAIRKEAGGIEPGELNAGQREVFEGIGCSLVVNAGAGTGKTKTLTSAYVGALLSMELDGNPLSSENIVAITYTKAAAEELRTRTVRMLQAKERQDLVAQMDDAWVSTIHAFCTRILREENIAVAKMFGIDPSFSVLEPEDSSEMLSEAIRETLEKDKASQGLYSALTERQAPDTVFSNIRSLLYDAKMYGIELSDDVRERPEILSQMPFGAAIDEYFGQFLSLAECADELYTMNKRALSSLDFNDLIYYVERLFKDDAAIREKYKKQFAILLIDEFQDTNFLQYKIFKHISEENLTRVGDKNQSIYGFQGAEVRVFESALREDGVTEVRLGDNYRSHGDILQMINAMFSADYLFGNDFVRLSAGKSEPFERHEPSSEHKRLKVHGFAGSKPPQIIEQQAQWIAKEFERLNKEGYSYGEMVVLLPTRNKGKTFQHAFEAHGIDAVVVGGDDLFTETYMQELILTLAFLDNPLDDALFTKVALSIFGRIPDEELVAITRQAKAAEPRGRAWESAVRFVGDAPESQTAFFVCAMQDALAAIRTQSPANVARFLITATGVDTLLLNGEELEGREESFRQVYANYGQVIAHMERLNEEGKGYRRIVGDLMRGLQAGSGYKAKVGQVSTKAKLGQGRSGDDVVQIMTIHGAKGLQYPVVAVPLFANGSRGEDGIIHAVDVETEPFTMKLAFNYPLNEAENEQFNMFYELAKTVRKAEIEKVKADNKASRGSGGAQEVPKSLAMNQFGYVSKKIQIGNDVRAHKKARDEAERLRLLYVALTRAEDRLLVSYSCPKKETSNEELSQKGDVNSKATARLRELLEEESLCDIVSFFDAQQADAQVDYKDADREDVCAGEDEAQEVPKDFPLGTDYAKNFERQYTFSETGTPKTLTPETGGEPGVRARYAPNPSQPQRSILQFSASNIDKFMKCPRQYWLGDVLRVGLPAVAQESMPATRATKGTAMHAVLELAARDLTIRKGKETNGPFPVSELLGEKIKSIYRLDDETVHEVLQAAEKVLASSWWKMLGDAQEVQPESQFYTQLEDAQRNEFFLQGFMDVYAVLKDGTALVIDYKSGVSKGSPEKYKIQMECYACAALSRKDIDTVEVAFLKPEMSDPEDQEKFIAITQTYTHRNMSALESSLVQAKRGMESVEENIEEGYLKKHVSSSVCSVCSYAGPLCPYGLKFKRRG
ncbi:MAG: UvrD-helicase domain-containing protein [Coriobacteriia bacterium]|nr:UvrD-helicase domain-containing protein [Coriobacteriia bacterium]